ncbi:TniQ family protein [Cellulomonas terrae]|uniref:TniQ domain-containing protein n=1 Tax=Cellulomonas terrae TaxID=311234 RepID=A0A511JJE9_9CELL|nr:TniQ family protein [Cellulomonas terrae]GEL98131.1 hypothetical protein CTE05_16780 [Cellulomonas terrae]
MTTALPVSVEPIRGEAIDSWLERLADLNGLSTAELMRAVAATVGGRVRFLTLAPDPKVVEHLARLGGVTAETVQSMTLAAHPGAVDLTGLDGERARESFRRISARGWVSGHGTQLCPACIGQDGVWRLAWRLPIVATCVRHRLLLLTECPACGRPFRDQGHSPLRPAGAATLCGNPIGAGPASHCPQPLASLDSDSAPAPAVDAQVRIDLALDDHVVSVLGVAVVGASYLVDLRHLTTLLTHLGTKRGTDTVAAWAEELEQETSHRTNERGPRWGISPPKSSTVRAGVLSEADRILAHNLFEEAVEELQRWLALAPDTNEGHLGWLADRTVMTPTLTRLVVAALAPHRRLSHHLDTGAPMIASTDAIPQVVPHELYVAHLTGLIDSAEQTVRTFASLCLARSDPAVRSWSGAASALGLPAKLGVGTARACSARMAVERDLWTGRLAEAARELPRRDFRDLEERVRHRTYMSRWYEEWARQNRPGSHPETRTYALVWLWIHVARGHVDSAPAWLGERPLAKKRALYRQFEHSLLADQERSLAYSLDKRA